MKILQTGSSTSHFFISKENHSEELDFPSPSSFNFVTILSLLSLGVERMNDTREAHIKNFLISFNTFPDDNKYESRF